MVLSLAFGAGAVVVGFYNWVSSLYTYNRDAWMTDVQVEQNHCYQSENLKIQMRSMDREEVRDVMQADINKVNNTILVVTLILALAGEMLFEGQVPPSCPAFVLNAYMICLSSAAFHLVLSILFGVFASHEAYTVATDLLTVRIRPDWSRHFKDLRYRRRHELTAAFEEKPASEIFRLPLASRFSKAMEGTLPATGGSSASAGRAPGEDEVNPPSEHDVSGTGGMEQIADWNINVREMWSESEAKWRPLTTCMFKCGAFGTQNLLEACGYWCLGTRFGDYSSAWAYWTVQVIFVALNWSMMMFLITKEMFKDLPGGVVAGDMVRCHSGGDAEEAGLTDMVGVVKGYGKKRDSVQVEFDGRVELSLVPENFDYVPCPRRPRQNSQDSSVDKRVSMKSLTDKFHSGSVQLQHDTRRAIMRWIWSRPWLVAAYPALGPVFCMLAVFTTDTYVDQFCIPMCFLFHMSVNIAFFVLVNVADNKDVAEQRSHDASSQGPLSHEGAPSASAVFAVPFFEGHTPLAGAIARYSRLEGEDSTNGDLNQERLAPPTYWGNVLQRLSFCSSSSEHIGSELEERGEQAPEESRNESELQKLPSVLMRCGMGVLIALWFLAFIWAFVGLTQGAHGLGHVDLKNSQGFLSFAWFRGGQVLFADVFMNEPPSPYFLASSVVCPADMVFVANKFSIYKNVVVNQTTHTVDKLEKIECDIDDTILDVDAQCVEEEAGNKTCTPILLLNGERPTVWMCRIDGCEGTGWPLLQTNRADKFTTLLTDDQILEKAFTTATIEDTRQYQNTLQVANASGFKVGDEIDIVDRHRRGPACVREAKKIRNISRQEGMVAKLSLESDLDREFKRGATVSKKTDQPPEKLVASDGQSVLEYKFSQQRGGYVPLWDVVAPEAVSDRGNLTALDFSKPNGRNRLVMFHTGGVVVSQDMATGIKCGEWTLPQGDTVVGGGCAYEDGNAMLALLKNASGMMMLKSVSVESLPETAECRKLKSANTTPAPSAGFGSKRHLRDRSGPP